MGKTYKYTLHNDTGAVYVQIKTGRVCRGEPEEDGGDYKLLTKYNYPDARAAQLKVLNETGEWFDIYKNGEKIK